MFQIAPSICLYEASLSILESALHTNVLLLLHTYSCVARGKAAAMQHH